MEILTLILALGLIATSVLLLVEASQAYRYKKEMDSWRETIESIIDIFDEVKAVTNTNANSLRQIQVYVDRHEKLLVVLSAVSELHSEALRINKNVKSKLTSTGILDTPVSELD
jgi:ABC-type xylose transport system substrate-binding protein